MVTSVPLHNAVWMDGIQVNANDLRLQTVAGMLTGASPSGSTGISARPGVRYGNGNPMQVNASSGMSVTVNSGVAFVQGSTSATSGMYTGCLDTTSTLTATTSDPTNPRIDNVIVQFVDNGNNTSTGTINIQAGTPAASPVAPTLPANSLLLAQISVGAGVSSITSGNITDKRVWTVASGGILPMSNTSSGITGQAGLYAHDLSSGRLRVSDGSGNARQPKLGAFGAVTNQVSGNVGTSVGSYTSVVSVSVTVDGVTEVEIYASWTGMYPGSGTAAGDYIQYQLAVDGFGGVLGSAAPAVMRVDSSSLNIADSGSIRGWITPSSGTHTFALMVESQGHAFQVAYPFIRVAPSLQQ
jgi:hypothetical protein